MGANDQSRHVERRRTRAELLAVRWNGPPLDRCVPRQPSRNGRARQLLPVHPFAEQGVLKPTLASDATFASGDFTMNRDRYRTVFCKRLGMFIAVSETARTQRKGSGNSRGCRTRATRSAAASFVLAATGTLWGSAALASPPPLPTGGEVVSGAGTIHQNGTTLTVNQSSQNLAANWQSFDIGANHSVVFNQPNSSS